MIKVHHPKTGHNWECSESSFETVWKERGWVKGWVEGEAESVPDPMPDPPEEEEDPSPSRPRK